MFKALEVRNDQQNQAAGDAPVAEDLEWGLRWVFHGWIGVERLRALRISPP